MVLWIGLVFGTLLAGGAICQKFESPCPRLFTYEPITANEPDKLYGNIYLLNDVEVNGIWLRLFFDKPSFQLGNWFGEVVSMNNKEYLIKNRDFKLLPNQGVNVRFYLKINPRETPPMLVRIKLNARTVCPEDDIITPQPVITGTLITSKEFPTTSTMGPQLLPDNTFPSPGTSVVVGRPPLSFLPVESDAFQGDFFNSLKPKPDSNSEVACGTVAKPPKPLITHGQATHEGEFPWHVALYHSAGLHLTYICGASLISKIHLLTAAHCVTGVNTNRTITPDKLVAYLGKYYLNKWSNSGIQDIHIEKIFVHPHYDPHSFKNDIAVLQMAQSAEITDYVRPVCLWEEDANLQNIIEKSGTVVGWGYDEHGDVTEELMKALMPVMSQETCLLSFKDFISRPTTSTTFCAGFKNGTSVCNGDSGGGMVFPKAGSSSANPVWQLRGLISISVALQNQFKCNSKHHVVFTDAAKYIDWIKSVL